MAQRYEARAQLWRWSVRGAGLGVGLLAVLFLALTAQAAANVIVMILTALLLASALRPVMHGARSRTPLPRVPIVLTLYVLMVMAMVTLVLLLAPPALDRAGDLVTQLPSFAQDASEWANELEPAVIGTALARLIGVVDQALMRGGVTSADPDTIVEIGLTASEVVLAVLSVFTMAFFWLISRETIQRFFLAMRRPTSCWACPTRSCSASSRGSWRSTPSSGRPSASSSAYSSAAPWP